MILINYFYIENLNPNLIASIVVLVSVRLKIQNLSRHDLLIL